jgi:hypothetical protein
VNARRGASCGSFAPCFESKPQNERADVTDKIAQGMRRGVAWIIQGHRSAYASMDALLKPGHWIEDSISVWRSRAVAPTGRRIAALRLNDTANGSC